MSTPTLKWAQRVDKVFVTFEVQAAKGVNVVFSDGLLSIDATAGSTTYKLENMTLFKEITSEESKWFANDRCASARDSCCALRPRLFDVTTRQRLPCGCNGSGWLRTALDSSAGCDTRLRLRCDASPPR